MKNIIYFIFLALIINSCNKDTDQIDDLNSNSFWRGHVVRASSNLSPVNLFFCLDATIGPGNADCSDLVN